MGTKRVYGMSKHMDQGVDDASAASFTSAETVDRELADLIGEADRLRTAEDDPRRGRWPASDYY